MDVGAHADGGPELLSHAHAEILFASAAAQILPPIGGVYPLFATSQDLRSTDFVGSAGLCRSSRNTPAQVPVIKAAFRPTAEEIDNATALV